MLLLDLDGTLVDSVDDLLASLNLVFGQHGLAPLTRADVVPMIGDGARVLLERAFAARGRAVPEGALDALLDHYTAHAAVLSKPFPGAADALEAMRAGGWRFAVCTNKPEAAARAMLDALGLSHWFDAVGGGDSFPARKPDPAHLLATLHAAGGTAGAAVMVGDHANDVQAAAGAGVPCVFAAWGYGPLSMAGGCPVAHGFADLPRLCESLLPSSLHVGRVPPKGVGGGQALAPARGNACSPSPRNSQRLPPTCPSGAPSPRWGRDEGCP